MRLSILMAGAALTLIPANFAQAANVEIVAQNPVIELSVSEQVDSAPDTATFSTGVETKAKTASQALSENSAQARKVVERLKALGIAEKDIQTTGINLRADYDYDQESRENRFVGYVVSNQVSATLHDISSKLGKILDAVVSSGATNLNGPSFSISDDSKMKDVARERALASAKSRAMSYARSEGYTGVRVLSISEGMSNQSEAPMMRMKDEVAASSAPVEPGQVGTVVSLNITYEMTR